MKFLMLCLIIAAAFSQNCSATDNNFKLFNELANKGFQLIRSTAKESQRELEALSGLKFQLIKEKTNEALEKLKPIEEKVVDIFEKLKTVFSRLSNIVKKAERVLKESKSTTQNLENQTSNAKHTLNIQYDHIVDRVSDLRKQTIKELESKAKDPTESYDMIRDKVVDKMKDKFNDMKKEILQEIEEKLSNRKNNLPALGPKNPQNNQKTGDGGESSNKGSNENKPLNTKPNGNVGDSSMPETIEGSKPLNTGTNGNVGESSTPAKIEASKPLNTGTNGNVGDSSMPETIESKPMNEANGNGGGSTMLEKTENTAPLSKDTDENRGSLPKVDATDGEDNLLDKGTSEAESGS